MQERANEILVINGDEITIPDKAARTIRELIEAKARFDRLETRLKDELLTAMESLGVWSFDHPLFTAVYKRSYTRTSFDSKVFKKEYPLIFQKYEKQTEVKPSVIISIK